MKILTEWRVQNILRAIHQFERLAHWRLKKMPDPITLAALGTLAVTEGVKFLYGQAGELIKYWREKKKAAAAPAATPEPKPPEVKLPEVFEGQLVAPKVHDDVLDRVQQNLSDIRK